MVSKSSITVIILFVSLVIVLAGIILSLTPTQNTEAGVVAGNVFTYDLKGYVDANDPNATLPAGLLQLNMTDWYRVTITLVSSSEVHFNTTWRFVNGTEIDRAGKVDLLTGKDNQEFWAIYPANLSINNLVRPLGTDGLIVNDTEVKTYKEGPRNTNVMTLNTQFVDVEDPTLSRTYLDNLYVHFDKLTGMLVELRDIKLYSDPQVILTYVWEIKDSNVWAIS